MKIYKILLGVVVLSVVAFGIHFVITFDAPPTTESEFSTYTVSDNPYDYPSIQTYEDAHITASLTDTNELLITSSTNIVQCNTYSASNSSLELLEEDTGMHMTSSTHTIPDQNIAITCLIDERLVSDSEPQEYLFLLVTGSENPPVINTDIEN